MSGLHSGQRLTAEASHFHAFEKRLTSQAHQCTTLIGRMKHDTNDAKLKS